MSDGVAFIDGEYMDTKDAKISIFDLGFVHSDVVYDVVSTWKGLFFRLDDHIERFLASCEGWRIRCPYDGDEIKRVLAECTYRAKIEDAYVKVLVARGPMPEDGSRDLRRCVPTFMAFAIPYAWIVPFDRQEAGISLLVAKTRRIPDESVDLRYKNFHWGDLGRAKFEAYDQGFDNAVLCTPTGVLAEGPGFNVFFLKDGTLHTPRRNALRGITRMTVFDLAAEMGIETATGDYSADDLREADEAFVCSTAGGIMPVNRVDDRVMSNGVAGAVSSQLRSLYWSKREAGWLGTPIVDLIEERAVA